MSRLVTPASIQTSPTASQPLLEAVKQQLGTGPTLTNYVNEVAKTELDFPRVELPASKAA